MPIYEYRCTGCRGEFEYRQSMREAARTVCESCGGLLERLISRSSFLLKGSGWYKDLYSSPKPDQPSKSTGDGAAASKESSSKESAATSSSDSSSSASSSAAAPASSSKGSDTAKAAVSKAG